MWGAMWRRIFKIVDPYILLMAGTVGLAVAFPARGMHAVVAGDAANIAIIFLFFLYGARISTRAAVEGLRHWRLHASVLLSTFVLFPMVGLLIKALLPNALSPELYSGLLFLCVVPSTVQSSIAFTSIARGNVPAALCSASASNILGVFLTPVLAGLILQTQGAQLNVGVFQDIMLQLLAPFALGQILRRWVGKWVLAQKQILGLLDRGSILLIIYVAFSKGMADDIWSRIAIKEFAALLALLAILLAVVMVVTTLIARRLIKLNTEDEIVMVFCGSKKSLASGLPIAGILFPASQLGMAILPLMIFHQLQLVVCAGLARRYGARPIPESTPVVSAMFSGTQNETKA
jgi:sodium/bile acid cotransporter 7